MSATSRIEIKTPKEIEKMRRAGLLLHSVFDELARRIEAGVTTGELDIFARKLIEDAGAIPAFLGYHGYPATLCTSVNDQIVHGIPGKYALKEGDIVSVDCGLVLEGFYADSAVTFPVGVVSDLALRLIDTTRRALYAGIEQMVPNNRLGSLSAAIQQTIEKEGFSVVREYTGHGIGRQLHEPPQILNYGSAGTGLRLKAGMVFAIEPMVNVGTWKTRVLEDEWTVVTADGSLSAHFEHTIAITDDGPMILTA